MILFCLDRGYDVDNIRYIAMLLTISSGLLMVSNFRYYSFKEIDLKGKVSFVAAIILMLVIGFVMAQPQRTLFILFTLYALSGPVFTLIMRRRRRKNRTL